MALKKNYVIVILTLFVLNLTNAAKLNVPRILLPIIKNVQPSFLLEDIDSGCHIWHTTRDDLITLTPIDPDPESENCSPKVLVATANRPLTKGKTLIIGEDHEGKVVKCDVVLDVIDKLTITTHTKELYIEDIPEVYTINALDDQDNEFSSLDGIEFIWEVHASSTSVVRFLPFKDSPYEAPKYIQHLENEDKSGNMALVQGVQTGTALISARLPYPDYKHIPAVEMEITVSANILLVPSEVYMMPGDTVEFTTFLVANSRLNQIDLKAFQYYLKAEDTSLIRLDKGSNQATALKAGKTNVKLASTRKDASKMPTVQITIQQPAYMTLTILPNRNWVVLVGDKYEIVVHVYSKDDHLLYLGKHVDVKLQIDDGFYVEQKSDNGTWLIGWGLRESKVLVKATLEAINHPHLGKFYLEEPLTATADLYIYPRIIIKPGEVILPWDPYSKPKFDVNMTAVGGDGKFLWSTTDSSMGYITQSGQLRTIKNGSFEVTAAMARNHHNRKSARISVLPPVRLEISEYNIEAPVDEPIYLHIATYARHPQSPTTFIPITLCPDIPVQVKLSNSNFHVNRSASIPLVGISCANIPVIADEVGICKVTITLELSGIVMEDSVVVSSYSPLRLIQPVGDIVLGVGADIKLFYQGGPTPLAGFDTTHQRAVVTENFNDIVATEDKTESYSTLDEAQIVVRVLCKKLGETKVSLLVSNTPKILHCKTRPAKVTTNIICGKPRSIRITPNLKLPSGNCPMSLSTDTVVVPFDQSVTFNVTVYDELGRPFKNATSFNVKWISSHQKVEFLKHEGVFSKRLVVSGVNIANGSAQIVKVKEREGIITIQAHVVGYLQSILDLNGITAENPPFIDPNSEETYFPEIKTHLKLLLMNKTTLHTSVFSVFNQPGLKQRIFISNGSGYITLGLSDTSAAEVTYKPGSRVIDVVPLRSGEFLIELRDQCLISEPVTIAVKVITVGRITVEMAGKVEINKCIEVIVTLYDEYDELIDIEDIKVVNVIYRLSKQIADITLAPFSPTAPWPKGELHYTLTGTEVDTTDVVFAFDLKGREITSNQVALQVFDPIQIFPRNSTMLIGSFQQLSIKGGPYPDCNIQFIVSNDKIIKIDATGVIEGLSLGDTQIKAQAIGLHPRTGDKVVYSEDTIDVHIVKLLGIKIACPIVDTRVGSVIPAWVTGIPSEITPIVLGSFDDSSVDFSWSIDENGVASITDVMNNIGIYNTPSDRISVRINALSEGTTTITVEVTLPGKIVGSQEPFVKFKASTEFSVKSQFHLVYPLGISLNWILMAPHSEIQIKTNFDDKYPISYSLPTEVKCQGSTETCATDAFTNILTITPKGKIKSTGKIGFGLLAIVSTDDLGNRRTLTYVIQVKPIHYMMLQVVAHWRVQLDVKLNSLPVGIEFELKHRFFDNQGFEFHAVPVEPKLRANRQDIFDLKTSSDDRKITSVLKAGVAVMKGWTEGEYHTADYIKIRTQNIIQPPVDFMVSGDLLCLTSPIVSRDFNLGKWISSNPLLVQIDNDLDVAVAIGNKEGTIRITNTLYPSVPIVLQVLPPAYIEFLPDPNMVITNGGIGTHYRINLVIRSVKCPKTKTKNLQGSKCDLTTTILKALTPFNCYIEFSQNFTGLAGELFKVKSSFTPNNGRYNCKVTVRDSPNPKELATMQTDLKIWAVSTTNNIESSVYTLRFLPNFYTEKEIHVENDNVIGKLDIIGLNEVLSQLRVEANDPSIIFVDSGTFVESTLLRFKVQVVDYHWKLASLASTMGISISSPLTSQNVMVTVIVDGKGLMSAQCVSPSQSNLVKLSETYQNTLVILISVLVFFFVTCFVYSRYLQPVVSVNVRSQPLTSSPIGSSFYNRPTVPRVSPESKYLNNTTIRDFSMSEGPIYGASGSSPDIRRNKRYL